MAVDVHHCPRCELRFANAAELRDHFAHDHRADPETFERYRYAPRRRAEAPAQPRRYLVVANQTLASDVVTRAVCDRAAEGPATFYLLVPATHSAQMGVPPASVQVDDDAGDDAGLAMARWRLRTATDRLHDEGVDVEGQVGHPDPVVAVKRVLAERPVDEILVSTLPAGLSRWLRVDLPRRLQRRVGLPVTTLTADQLTSVS